MEFLNTGGGGPTIFDLGGGGEAWQSECAESLIRDPVDELSPLISRGEAEPLLKLRKTLVMALPLDPPRVEEEVSKISGNFHLSKAEICFEACLMNLRAAIDPVERDREWLVKALPTTLHQGRKASSSCCSDSANDKLTPYAVGSERKRSSSWQEAAIKDGR